MPPPAAGCRHWAPAPLPARGRPTRSARHRLPGDGPGAGHADWPAPLGAALWGQPLRRFSRARQCPARARAAVARPAPGARAGARNPRPPAACRGGGGHETRAAASIQPAGGVEAIHLEQAAGLPCRPSWAQVRISKVSSRKPKPPGRAMKASASSAMRALRSCMDCTTSRRVRPRFASSAVTSCSGMMPMTWPPAARAASLSAPIRPTWPPP